jgi:hypothetical protein
MDFTVTLMINPANGNATKLPDQAIKLMAGQSIQDLSFSTQAIVNPDHC